MSPPLVDGLGQGGESSSGRKASLPLAEGQKGESSPSRKANPLAEGQRQEASPPLKER